MNLSDIKGQEHAKRALEVALAGKHSFVMCGAHGVGKSMMLSAIDDITPFDISLNDDIQDYNYRTMTDTAHDVGSGMKLYGATRLCPCGYHGGDETCMCEVKDILHLHRRLRVLFEYVDIVVDMPSVRLKDYANTGEDSKDMIKRISRANLFGGVSLEINDSGQEMMRLGITQLNFNARRLAKTKAIARSIANLDESETIRAEHVAEALQYGSYLRKLLYI